MSEPLDGRPVRLLVDPDDRHHLEVRRAEAGAPVEVLDGRGAIGVGRLDPVGKQVYVQLETVRSVPRPPDLVLLIGAGDRDRLLWVIEKAQELGATSVVPVITKRSQSVATRLRDSQLDRLRRRSVEAMKQSGNAWLVSVGEPIELNPALQSTTAPIRWLADQDGADPALTAWDGGAAVLVGPEGGLTEEERGLAEACGFAPTRLAATVLRFETAAIAALAILAVLRRGSP